MDSISLTQFAANSLEFGSVRRALEAFRDDYQQPQELLLTLGWLVAIGRAPTPVTIETLYAIAQQWDQQHQAPLRRLLKASIAADDDGRAGEQRQALAQLSECLLEQLQELAISNAPLDTQVAPPALGDVLLRALPKIGFCQGQSELLDRLVDRWELDECLDD